MYIKVSSPVQIFSRFHGVAMPRSNFPTIIPFLPQTTRKQRDVPCVRSFGPHSRTRVRTRASTSVSFTQHSYTHAPYCGAKSQHIQHIYVCITTCMYQHIYIYITKSLTVSHFVSRSIPAIGRSENARTRVVPFAPPLSFSLSPPHPPFSLSPLFLKPDRKNFTDIRQRTTRQKERKRIP